jgi:hypothetical protein
MAQGVESRLARRKRPAEFQMSQNIEGFEGFTDPESLAASTPIASWGWRSLCRNRQIEHLRVGRRYFIRKDVAEAFLAAATVAAAHASDPSQDGEEENAGSAAPIGRAG